MTPGLTAIFTQEKPDCMAKRGIDSGHPWPSPCGRRRSRHPKRPSCRFVEPRLSDIEASIPLCPIIKKAPVGGLFNYGGERGIRTLDTGLPYTHFPGVLLQPLGHLSGRARKVKPDNPVVQMTLENFAPTFQHGRAQIGDLAKKRPTICMLIIVILCRHRNPLSSRPHPR